MIDRALVINSGEHPSQALWSLARPLFAERELALSWPRDLSLRVCLVAAAPRIEGPTPTAAAPMTVKALSAESGVKINEILRAALAGGIRANMNTELAPEQIALVQRMLPFTAGLDRLVTGVPLTGSVVDDILRLARFVGAELLVVDSNLPEATELFRSSRRPILATPAAADPESELEVRRILLALDGSERVAGIVPLVAAVARAFRAGVRIMPAGDPPPSVPDRSLLTVRDRLLDHGVHASLKAGDGVSAKSIVGIATRERACLIAIDSKAGTNKRGGRLGPMAEEVVRRTPCPFLLLESAGDERGIDGG